MEPNHNLLDGGLTVDHESFLHLRETAKWAKFLAIVGFIFSGLLVILGLSADAILQNAGPESRQVISPAVFMIIYIVLAAINFLVCLYLYRFAVNTQSALNNSDQYSLTAGFASLKTVFRIMGILMIIYLGIIILVLLAGFFAAIMAS